MSRLMYGRYGTDQLNRFLLAVALISMILSLFVSNLFYWVAVVTVVFAYFRMLSKNIYKRRAENETYLRITGRFRKSVDRAKDKQYRYYKCPSCKQTVRVPRGKGKISITCPKCRTEFIKKT